MREASGSSIGGGMRADDIQNTMDAGAAQRAERADPVAISVVITNYNYARYLPRAIASVLAQTHPNVQGIVVDDGSTDDSLGIARGFDGISVVAKANGGQVSAVVEGVARATGAVILFLDSDDALYPEACAAVAAAYDPAVTLYQGELDIVDPAGRRIGGYPDAPLIVAGQREYVLRHGFFPSSPTSGNAFAATHVRRMLAEVGEERRYFIDGYLIYSAPFFGRVARLGQSLGSYLVHGGNVSLSAGVDRRSAEKSLRNALWQRSGIVNAMRLQDRAPGAAADYLTAWQLRYLLILRCSYGVTDIAPELSTVGASLRALRKFAIYPGISIPQRLKNMALVLALAGGARAAGKRIVPPRD